MANSTVNLVIRPVDGRGARQVTLPVDGGSHIFAGTMVSQLTATAMLVPGSTASSGPCIGVAVHEQDASAVADSALRCQVLYDGIFAFANSGTDPVAESSLFGAVVYMENDHTVAKTDATGTLKAAGYFVGMEPNGYVRVYIPLAPNA